MRSGTGLAVAFAIVAGCGFDGALGPGDAEPDSDGVPFVEVGFGVAGSTTDEGAGTLDIAVVLSEPTSRTVTVEFGLGSTGSATADDFTFSGGTLTIPPGSQGGTIPITLIDDGPDGEMAETVVLQLSNPQGANLVGDIYTLTISPTPLPRVTIAMNATVGESGTVDLVITLDSMPTMPASIDYTIAGTAEAGDFTIPAGPLALTMLSHQVPITITTDDTDEDDETITVTLVQPDGIVLGAETAATLTVMDNDAAPSVAFTASGQDVSESGGAGAAIAQLTQASEKAIAVDFDVPAGASATGSDFVISNPTMTLTFPPGTTTRAVDFSITSDTGIEGNEFFDLRLVNPNGNVTIGSIGTHRITIVDDDQPTCYGPSGVYQVCATKPTIPLALGTETVNTQTDGRCAAPPANWVSSGHADACFLYGSTITQTGVTRFVGSKAVVLVSDSTLTISGTIDVASHVGVVLPGAGAPASCSGFAQAPIPSNSSGGGGGAGGSFMTDGGDGGTGNGGNQAGRTNPSLGANPTRLRAGCNGQGGGPSGNTAGAPGQGGGAIYVVAAGPLTLAGIINASGAAGAAGGDFTGGSGAGSGGMVKLFAPAITATGGVIMTNGGGGSSGGDQSGGGSSGSDPSTGTPLQPPSGGGGGGNGGGGFAGGTTATDGNNGSSNQGGGGGGGGGGFLESNRQLAGATISSGARNVPP